MSKRIPLPCTPDNCGDLFAKCGKTWTYAGLKCRCDACYEANRSACRASRLRNIEARREFDRKRYQEVERKRSSNACARAWAKQNRDRHVERNRRWREENPAAAAACTQRYIEKHPERKRASVRASSSKRRALKLATAVVPFTAEQLHLRMSYYGNRCYIRMDGVCTGAFDDVDHVKPLSKGGAHMLSNLRPACEPCNSRKHNRWPFPLK